MPWPPLRVKAGICLNRSLESIWHTRYHSSPLLVCLLHVCVSLGLTDKRPDEVQLLELLQKLLVSVSRTDKPVLKQYQKRCEAVLVDVLYKGTCRTVSTQGSCTG